MFFKGSRKTCKKTNFRKEKIPDGRMCSECEYCDLGHGTRIKDCICTCMFNPKNPINMGNILHAQHKNRKKMKEEQERGRK